MDSPPDRREPAAPGSSSAPAFWEELLKAVRGRKMMLASFLEHGMLGGLEDEAFSIVFDNNYYEGMVGRRENLGVIEEAMEGIVGRRVSCRVRTGVVASRPSGQAGTKSGGPAGDLLQENPGLRRIMNELGGQMLPGDTEIGG
jgi:hypothetical protein